MDTDGAHNSVDQRVSRRQDAIRQAHLQFERMSDRDQARLNRGLDAATAEARAHTAYVRPE
ncbi:hypothetical protein JCM9803A_23790 [Rhodococcus erythropolis]